MTKHSGRPHIMPGDESIGHLYPILQCENLFTLPLDYVPPPEVQLHVPQPSRRDDLNFSKDAVPTLPNPLPEIKSDVVFPIIRENGVADAIKVLSEIFGLKTYKVNMIEYWFLDIVADCLWRVQDEFCLPNDMQRIIVSWIIYFLNILKDTDKNYNHEEIFDILKETATLAGDCINDGDPWLPNPADLAAFMTPEDMFEINEAENKFCPDETNVEIDYIDLRKKDGRHIYVLENPSVCSSSTLNDDDERSMSSVFDSYDEDADITSISRNVSQNLSPKSAATLNGLTGTPHSMNASQAVTPKSAVTSNGRTKGTTDTKKVIADYRNLFQTKTTTSLDSETAENLEIAEFSKRAMLAILDYIFEYFSSEFQYYIVREALTNPPNYLMQKINTFHYPKRPFGEDQKVKGKPPTREAVVEAMVFKTSEELIRLPSEEARQIRAQQDAIRYAAAYKKTQDYKNYIYPLKEAVGEDFYEELFPPNNTRPSSYTTRKSK